jgi:hypothetical protein
VTIRLYLDEDSIDDALIVALRVRGVDLFTPADAGMMERDDPAQLDHATAQGRVLYTRNVGHFFQLHTEYLSVGKPHAGIVMGRHDFTIGEQMRGLLRLIATRSAEEMMNQAVFLGSLLAPEDESP